LRSSVKPDGGRMKWVKAAIGKQVKLIPVDEVLYFQSDTKYTRVVSATGEALIRTPLKDLLCELDPEKFWQVHRGTIVNLDAVSGVLRADAERQFIILKNRQEKLPISRQFTHLFKQM
jgi:DNA-binding LytR/AlgR family response regulator